MKETGLTGKRRSTTIEATPDDGKSQRERRRSCVVLLILLGCICLYVYCYLLWCLVCVACLFVLLLHAATFAPNPEAALGFQKTTIRSPRHDLRFHARYTSCT